MSLDEIMALRPLLVATMMEDSRCDSMLPFGHCGPRIVVISGISGVMGEPIRHVLAGGATTKGLPICIDKSIPDDCSVEGPVYCYKPRPCLLCMLLVCGLRRMVRGLSNPVICDCYSRCGASILLYCVLLWFGP